MRRERLPLRVSDGLYQSIERLNATIERQAVLLREARQHCQHSLNCALTQASVHNRLFEAACTCGFSEWWTRFADASHHLEEVGR